MLNLVKKPVTVSNYYGIVTVNKQGCFGCGACTMYPVGRRVSNSNLEVLLSFATHFYRLFDYQT